jgi:hypothetical protein
MIVPGVAAPSFPIRGRKDKFSVSQTRAKNRNSNIDGWDDRLLHMDHGDFKGSCFDPRSADENSLRGLPGELGRKTNGEGAELTTIL